MATVNKNFKVKHGLVVEGTTGTINGEDILTEGSGDAYIIDLVGGESFITSTSNEFDVSAGKELSIDRTVVDAYYDAAGSAGDVASDLTDHESATEAHGATGAVVGTTNTQTLTNKTISYADNTLTVQVANVSDLTASASELNTLDGITASTAELNLLDGVTATTAELNILDGVTATASELNILDGVTATSSELNLLDGVTATTTELNYVDGVTSGIQGQLDDKAPLESPALTGVPTAPTATAGTNSTQVATTAYADAAVAALVDGAPDLLNTLNELAAALDDNPDVIGDLQDIAAGKQDTLTAGDNIDITGTTISVTGLVAADISDFGSASQTANIGYYDPAGSAQTAEDNAIAHADGLAVNYDPAGTAQGIVDALDTDDISEGTAQYFTDARAKTSAADLLTNASLTNITITGNGSGLTITAENGVADSTTSDLAEGTNLYFTNQRALDATAAAYDAAGAAATAESNANDYTDEEIGDLTTDDIEEGATNLYFTNQRALDATAAAYDEIGSGSGALTQANSYTDGEITTALTTAQGYADTAEADAISAAEAYTDGRETAITTAYEAYADQAEVDAKAYTDTRETAITTAYEAYADTAEADAKAYADAEIAALVNGAPELLDTLNELAAAIGDDENFAANLATSVGEKVAKAGDTMTGLLVLSADPSANLGAATKQYVDTAETDAVATAEAYTDGEITTALTTAQGYADTAESNAIAHADALTTDDVAEGSVNEYFTDARAVDALEAVVPNFTEVDINSVATQVAATGSATAATATTVYSFAKADYRSAKFLVKVAYSTHTEISEVLLTLDTSDNIAITEYAIVGTNGTLSAVSAAVSGANVNLLVTPTNTSTVTVMGTLLA
jgi:hypothetical protein